MSETRVIRSLGVESEGHAYFFSYEEGPPPADHFRLDTLYTGISAGTELTFLRGTNPYLHASWDAELGLFRPGQPSTHYPVPFFGYMEVGRVIESRTPVVNVGDIVAMTYGHKSGHTVDAEHEFYMPIPPDLDPILGIYLAQMGPICANALLHAAADLVGPTVRDLGDGVRGRRVVVMGAGVVGLLTALFARHWGADEVVVVNSAGPRLTVAAALGFPVINESEQEAGSFCKAYWHHGPHDRGADLVFQCRASGASLQAALRSLRPQGTVIDLAFYQSGAPEVRLGEEFHHNSLNIRAAQIGRVPLGLAHNWSRRRLAAETLTLLRACGAEVRRHMITHVVPFDDSPAFLTELGAKYQPDVIQAVLATPAAAELPTEQASGYHINGKPRTRQPAAQPG